MSAKAGFLMPLRSVLNGPDSVKLKTAAQKKELETTFHSVGCKKRQFHYPLCPCLRIAINPFPNPIVATRAQWPEIIDRHSQVRALLERDDVVNDIRQRDSAHPLTLHAERRLRQYHVPQIHPCSGAVKSVGFRAALVILPVCHPIPPQGLRML